MGERREPIYLKFIRRSQQKKLERESTIKETVSHKLKKSIGYQILLNMGWIEEKGLGKNKDGKTTIKGLIHHTKKQKPQAAGAPRQEIDNIMQEYDELLKKYSGAREVAKD